MQTNIIRSNRKIFTFHAFDSDFVIVNFYIYAHRLLILKHTVQIRILLFQSFRACYLRSSPGIICGIDGIILHSVNTGAAVTMVVSVHAEQYRFSLEQLTDIHPVIDPSFAKIVYKTVM